MPVCAWAEQNARMRDYHDKEWGRPSRDDTYLLEMLCLEGAQAGLSWNTVLSKRQEYQKAFHGFEPSYCASLSDEKLEDIARRFNVIKNMPKLRSVRTNARAVLCMQTEYGSFSEFMWRYVQDRPVIHYWQSEAQIPAKSQLSEHLSRDLKKNGFRFVGPVTVYSLMQAIGMVDDHLIRCPCHSDNRQPDGENGRGMLIEEH